jgi:hypothetical protein
MAGDPRDRAETRHFHLAWHRWLFGPEAPRANVQHRQNGFEEDLHRTIERSCSRLFG